MGISRDVRVQYVQSIGLSADAVDLAVEILDGRRVLLVETVAEKSSHDGRLAHLRRPEHDHALAVLRRRGRRDLVQKLRHRVGPIFQPGRHPVSDGRSRTTPSTHLPIFFVSDIAVFVLKRDVKLQLTPDLLHDE